MNLHEYQAKTLFREFGLPVSEGSVASDPSEAVRVATEMGGERWAVKVQIHAGGRGKAGGVKVLNSLSEVSEFAESWLGKRMVTAQTDARGQPVNSIYVEAVTSIARELYLGAVIDRASQQLVVMASTEGGVEIEQVAQETPDKILRETIDPAVGAQPYQGRALADGLHLEEQQVSQFTNIFLNLCRMFEQLDCSLVEVNPLVVTDAGDVHCLDAKITIDSNALFRQQRVAAFRDDLQEDERESAAARHGLSYVALDGNIGCMVNGAGLAMGTMDLVKLLGGNPANFLDVGGGVDANAVGEALKIIVDDPEVKAILINIFGGIVSCATIAEGIAGAVQEVGVEVPVVVRFDGNSSEEGREVLKQSGLNIIVAHTLEEAAAKAVEVAG